MKTLAIYFSFSGNNRRLAEYLGKSTGCDILPIVEKKRRTLFTVFLDMLFNRRPKIEPLQGSIADYDHIILIAPVWASKIANPMKSLLKMQQPLLRSYSFISLCGYDRPEQTDTINRELVTLIGRAPKALAELKICDILPTDKKNDIKAISAYRVSDADLDKLKPQIDGFLKSIEAG